MCSKPDTSAIVRQWQRHKGPCRSRTHKFFNPRTLSEDIISTSLVSLFAELNARHDRHIGDLASIDTIEIIWAAAGCANDVFQRLKLDVVTWLAASKWFQPGEASGGFW